MGSSMKPAGMQPPEGPPAPPRPQFVSAGGLPPKAVLGRVRRSGPRITRPAFHGRNQRRLLSTHKRARSPRDGDVKVEACAQDVFAEQTVLAGLIHGDQV